MVTSNNKEKRRPSDENRRSLHSWLPSDSNGTPLPCPRAHTSWGLYQILIAPSRKTLWDRHGQWHLQAKVSVRQEHTKWRRGADSNRRVKVLQTSPLTAWVPRHVTHDRRSGRGGQPELAAEPKKSAGLRSAQPQPQHGTRHRHPSTVPHQVVDRSCHIIPGGRLAHPQGLEARLGALDFGVFLNHGSL